MPRKYEKQKWGHWQIIMYYDLDVMFGQCEKIEYLLH